VDSVSIVKGFILWEVTQPRESLACLTGSAAARKIGWHISNVVL
jgi:hypothetical protein